MFSNNITQFLDELQAQSFVMTKKICLMKGINTETPYEPHGLYRGRTGRSYGSGRKDIQRSGRLRAQV